VRSLGVVRRKKLSICQIVSQVNICAQCWSVH